MFGSLPLSVNHRCLWAPSIRFRRILSRLSDGPNNSFPSRRSAMPQDSRPCRFPFTGTLKDFRWVYTLLDGLVTKGPSFVSQRSLSPPGHGLAGNHRSRLDPGTGFGIRGPRVNNVGGGWEIEIFGLLAFFFPIKELLNPL